MTPSILHANTSRRVFAAATALLAVSALIGTSQRVLAQPTDRDDAPLIRSSGPLLAASGERLLLCAANNLAATVAPPTTAALAPAASPSLNVTLQILNGITGAVLAQRQITLPPLGTTELPPDPCISFTVPPATFAPSANLFVVRVALNPQPLPPGLCSPYSFSVSAQIFTLDTSGNPANIRAIAFEPPDPCLR